MLLKDELPWWAHSFIICGNEGEGDGGAGAGDGDGSGEGGSGDDDGDGDGDDSGDGDGDSGDDDADDAKRDTAGLKSALQKERKAAKQAAKDLRAANQRLEELDAKDRTEVERATAKAEKAEEKATKLAAGLKKQALNAAIERIARDMKFKDVDDAISLVDRKDMVIEQDDDDPSDIDIDLKSVKTAVKALADKKKHLIDAEGEGDPSGSKFGGKGGNKQKQTEEELRKKYPALQ